MRELRLIANHANDFFEKNLLRQVILRLLKALLRHNAGRTANSMAFDLFLAFVPMLALAGWTLTAIVKTKPDLLQSGSILLDVTPEQLHRLFATHFESAAAQTFAPLAVLGGWWLASSAFFTMIRVFEESFDCTPRSWLQSRLLSLFYALLGMMIFVVGGASGAFFAVAKGGFFSELVEGLRAWGLIRFVVAGVGMLVVAAFFAILYRIAIHRPGRKRRMWPGALVAALLGALASMLFGYYASHVPRFALFYGSLATVAMLLLWLWLWSTAILLGAELNILLEDLRDGRTSPSSRPGPS